jgi:L-threonylcarbamoyladenylate synthase
MSLWPATPEGLANAAGHLRAGGVLGLPTETVYGLAADATNPTAVARVFATKGRPVDHPLIVHLAVGAPVVPWVADWPITAERLAAAFWPGPLTLVVPCSSAVLSAVTGGQDTVALRVPAHPVAQAVLAAFGGALVAPSANRYGRLSPTRAADVVEEFAGSVPVVEGGECAVGIESTIVACLNGQVRVLRPGLITPGEVSRAAATYFIKELPRELPRELLKSFAPLAQDRAGWHKLVTEPPFKLGKPFVRQPRGDTRVTPEDKQRLAEQRAAEIAKRRADFNATNN